MKREITAKKIQIDKWLGLKAANIKVLLKENQKKQENRKAEWSIF